jgi:hypothetical protein
MSSGAQVDLDWAGSDAAQGGASTPAASPANAGAAGSAYLTDEEILGMDPPSPDGGYGGLGRQGGSAPSARAVILSEAKNLSSIDRPGGDATRRDSSGEDGPQNDKNQLAAAGGRTDENPQAEARATLGMPSWMATLAADPAHGGEARQLWREHQEFRAAFSSSEEARAIKELLPGGVRDVLSLREATQSVDRIDAALFSGDSRAQSEVVAELARANPAAFRAMFAEAAKVLAGIDAGGRGQAAGGREERNFDGGGLNRPNGAAGELAGTNHSLESGPAGGMENRRRDAGATAAANPLSQELRASESRSSDHGARDTGHGTPPFDSAAYASFERATNDAVAREVRGSIGDTLARVMPDGVAEGAARRIGEDIFNEVHRALAADRALSEQVAGVLRDRRFGGAEQQRVASLLASRAKQLVPSVARRVIGEWTSTVLNTARSKAARQAAAASRVDIAAPGGALNSTPLRQMSQREVNYASMSDEEILGI